MTVEARLLSIGTANPPQRYTQADLLERFRVADPRVRSLFQSGHIRTRHLVLPEPSPDAPPAPPPAPEPLAEGRWTLTISATDDQGLTSSATRRFALNSTLGFLEVTPAPLLLRKSGGETTISWKLARAARVRVRAPRVRARPPDAGSDSAPSGSASTGRSNPMTFAPCWPGWPPAPEG